MKQPAVERAQGVLRLEKELCRPIGDFTGLAGVSEETLVRYATQGKKGVWLDAVLDRERRVWMTSAQAVSRFLVAVAEKEKAC